MDALGGCGGAGGFWGWNGFDQRRKKKSSDDRGKQRNSRSSDSVDLSSDAGGYRFPLKQAVTAGALTFTGDTIAQLSGRWKKRTALKQSSSELDEVRLTKFWCLSSNGFEFLEVLVNVLVTIHEMSFHCDLKIL